MVYDNLKTVVDQVKPGKERQFNRRFMALANHYLFKPVACTPAAGWEKGQVENQVGNIREWLFTPRVKFDSFEALNQDNWGQSNIKCAIICKLQKGVLLMARLVRVSPVGVPQHIVQRGNNRQVCFGGEEDMKAYLNWLKEFSKKYNVDVHAWVLMTNHVHLLSRPRKKEPLAE